MDDDEEDFGGEKIDGDEDAEDPKGASGQFDESTLPSNSASKILSLQYSNGKAYSVY
jgi:hypothetical protein